MYDKLGTKVNNIDTNRFALKTKYNIDKSDLEKKVSDADKIFLILVGLFRKHVIMPRLLKWKVKYRVLVA